ncbi:MAG: hypothetical protein ACR2IS_07675 [Nitrososphaeraceae archaeon]
MTITEELTFYCSSCRPDPITKPLANDHVPGTMKALADVKSLILFETISVSSPSGLRSNDLNRNQRLTSKQLYSRVILIGKCWSGQKTKWQIFSDILW